MKKNTATRQQGFTLLELLIVFSIMVILSGVGIASYVTYSQSQAIATNAQEFKTMLFTARSRALSQLRDNSCFSSGFSGVNYQLAGYRIVLCCTSKVACRSGMITCVNSKADYEMDAVYSASDGSGIVYQACVDKAFTDPHVTFDMSSNTTITTITFDSVTGAVTTNATSNPLQVAINGYGITKYATISATGVVQ